jgi:hypothetical protein
MVDYKEEIDYNFIEVNGFAGIKIAEVPFKGVIYTYSNVSIAEAEGTSEEAVLSFNFDVIDLAGCTEEEIHTVEFKSKIGDILLSILQNSVENKVESEQTNFEESSL